VLRQLSGISSPHARQPSRRCAEADWSTKPWCANTTRSTATGITRGRTPTRSCTSSGRVTGRRLRSLALALPQRRPKNSKTNRKGNLPLVQSLEQRGKAFLADYLRAFWMSWRIGWPVRAANSASRSRRANSRGCCDLGPRRAALIIPRRGRVGSKAGSSLRVSDALHRADAHAMRGPRSSPQRSSPMLAAPHLSRTLAAAS
jgi:hypothetical protein